MLKAQSSTNGRELASPMCSSVGKFMAEWALMRTRGRKCGEGVTYLVPKPFLPIFLLLGCHEVISLPLPSVHTPYPSAMIIRRPKAMAPADHGLGP